MMKWLLENKQGMKIAMIVNDMAELNIDATLIKSVENAGGALQKHMDREMVELQNGCICCNLREDLLVEVHKLAEMQRFDYLVIESSGICEPKPIAETFAMNISPAQQRRQQQRNHTQQDRLQILNSRARLDTMVSVVDCQNFWDNLKSLEVVAQKYEQYEPTEEEGRKAVADLLVEQVEFANVIVLNKVDLIKDKKQIEAVRKLVQKLNPDAKIYETKFSKIDPKVVLNTQLFDMEKLLGSAGWLKELKAEKEDAKEKKEPKKEEGHSHGHKKEKNHGHGHGHGHGQKEEKKSHGHEHGHGHGKEECKEEDCEHEHGHAHAQEDCKDKNCTHHGHSHAEGHSHDHGSHYGIISFVYRRRKPFHPGRLFNCLDKHLKGVMRSKGYSWLATRHNRIAEWNNAGKLFRIDGGQPWFDANMRFRMALKHHPKLLEEPQVKLILKEFVKPWGDRRQEIVIIGTGIQEKKIAELLDECLLTEEEMKVGPRAWKKYLDPLPRWQPMLGLQDVEDEEEEEEEEDFRNLRFKVGDKVECCIQPDKWAPGTIMKIKYRGSSWPKTRKSAPYQIELDDGKRIFAPFDDDRVIRKPTS
eukprot:CAMPEP_0167754740 /NCGR_PEP_ID=MMETSP0110_2-20121227/8441_1 /TAXON_ID=629695 /ORGANISM="Gymnochlora sp., Strain CCMP2014" /LENGTH=586 /DNA_ID=CAMNT_0007640659 /DNA_START=209 /DNA_END=1969 /DNA_ORIENTATION=+